ncbi:MULTISPECIES: hypothetical protein [Bacillus]|uniref:hypothetical protein n=1 Tax=Bacillus TaxID=1386 RepID=UPI0007762BF6|nr:hypothetical protein [Bacillus pumilus]AMM99326.1 hypothetical protein UP12_19055 [Bacillus pumilus]MDH3149806.1 hypothetical protein [Bacillus pumilus]MEB2356981.1 hypothetical protein [Bacillus pumilus]WLP59679.1 hypothetical protein Q8W18_19250 [Bacillus pumilus]
MIRLHCLHAHPSNQSYIEDVFHDTEIELHHTVDSSFIERATQDPDFNLHKQQTYAINKLMKEDEADIILLTCTQYIAALGDQQHLIKQPIVPIDEPLFELICQRKGPLQLVFSNPDTVDGTMERLKSYAKEHGKQIDAEVMVMEDVFHLCLNGDMSAYEEQIKKQLRRCMKKSGDICVMQLSMVHAAQQMEKETGIPIIQPLSPLKQFVHQTISALKE